MTFYLLLLFFTTFLAGLIAFFTPISRGKIYKLALVFAGAYLFAITIIHILPELYFNAENPTLIGLYVLGGFFLQQVLEYFSRGAEHGHVHHHSDEHGHSLVSTFPVIIALSIHAFLEGSLLAHPGDIHEGHDATALFFGILLHKAPAAFALMTIVLCYLSKKWMAILLLLLFSLASPLGMIVGHSVYNANDVSQDLFTILFGVVSGNFLHISTSIVFESSADHRFNARRFGTALLGAMVAVIAEMFI